MEQRELNVVISETSESELRQVLADASRYQQKGQLTAAIECYQRALRLKPDQPQICCDIGNVFQGMGRLDDAAFYFQRILPLKPNSFEAYNNIANIFLMKGQLAKAIYCYQRAVILKPDFGEAYGNMGLAFQYQGKYEGAVSCYKKGLRFNPKGYKVLNGLLYLLMQFCDWPAVKDYGKRLDQITETELLQGEKTAESPFSSVIRHDDPALNFSIAKAWSAHHARSLSGTKMSFSFEGRKRKKKITIGYFSSDFKNHATAHLMTGVFESHRRDLFEVNCYSYGKMDNSLYLKRIRKACNLFADVSGMDHMGIAKRMYEDRVDILVDLKGYTKDNRLAVLALRPAPVQVTYLGFPGTTGANFIDYIITDKIVTPEAHLPYYSEQCVFMPRCYQSNDNNQRISDKKFTRSDFNLPRSGIVFCSFNQTYKIESVMFGVWMNILRKVPGSVLWLLSRNKTTISNLRREAGARGVAPDRLIFSGNLPKDEHLARQKLADLALDTRIYNGHTTTSDILWSGVPVITLEGTHFASRVASSILQAAGLPELVTHTLQEYEALAVKLVTDPAALADLRRKVEENRFTAPLFDTPRFARNLEKAYAEMWQIWKRGERPHRIG